MKINNITLIGMPGAGKSTLGVVLAKILGYEFLDSDLLIQKEEKRRLYQIIDEEGEEGFKAIENRVNASIETEDTVIATGGSVVYCSEAMEHLKSIGKVVYLRLSLESLEKRLGNLKKRGVLLKEGQTLKSLYEERVPLYEKYADIVVDEEGKDLEASLPTSGLELMGTIAESTAAMRPILSSMFATGIPRNCSTSSLAGRGKL